MAEREIKLWDVVRLKSGGPNMTVTDPKSMAGIYCTWFNHKGNHKQDCFHKESLEVVPYPWEKGP